MVKYDSTYNLRHYERFKEFRRHNNAKSFLICNRFKDDAYFIDGKGNKQPLKSMKTNYINNIQKHKTFLKVKTKIKDPLHMNKLRFKNKCTIY